jgi:hypothetical protein
MPGMEAGVPGNRAIADSAVVVERSGFWRLKGVQLL